MRILKSIRCSQVSTLPCQKYLVTHCLRNENENKSAVDSVRSVPNAYTTGFLFKQNQNIVRRILNIVSYSGDVLPLEIVYFSLLNTKKNPA